jgi:DNA repair protein RecO (recombination protein O)
MPLIRDRALVLQAFPYSDTSKILRLFCVDHGLRSVIAKGAQRSKSRFGGLLEPFTEGEAQFYLREGRDLHTLSDFDLLRSRQALGRNLAAFSGASLIAELVLRFGTEEPHPELFHAAVDALDRLAGAPAADVVHTALAAVWEVVGLLGYQPELESCVHCGRQLDPEEAVRVDVEAGGAACTRCRPSGRVVDAASRREALLMSRGQRLSAPPADAGLHRALLRAFLATHLSPGHPLRSLDLFVQEIGHDPR